MTANNHPGAGDYEQEPRENDTARLNQSDAAGYAAPEASGQAAAATAEAGGMVSNETVANPTVANPTVSNETVSNPTEPIAAPTNSTLPLHEWWNQRHEAAAAGTTPEVPTPPSYVPTTAQPQVDTTAAAQQPVEESISASAPFAAPVTTPVAQQEPAAPRPQYGQYAPQQPGHPYQGQDAQYAQSGHGAHAAPAQEQQHTAAYPYQGALPAAVNAPSKKRIGTGALIATVLAAALVGGGVGGGAMYLLDGQRTSASSAQQPLSSPVIVNNKDSVNAVTAAAAKASPSVVTISASSGNSGGTGSGIILDTDGHILTNTHVVTLDGAAANAAIEVQLANGKVYKGTIVGTDPLSDLAVVKIDAPDLVPATLGDSSKTNVGDTVLAIGAPLGLSGTVTDGIVSTANRTIQVASSAVPDSGTDSGSNGDQGGNGFNFAPPNGSNGSSNAAKGTVNLNVIQTDAAINPGNSGGALVNLNGEVIGVNVAIASAGSSSSTDQSGNIGVGFSIPIDTAKRIAQEVIANGKATHGQLGVSVQAAAANGNSNAFSNGAVLATVDSGTPAAAAGLKKGDIITGLANRTIADASELTAAVREQAGGATVKVTFIRDGKTQTVDVTLGSATS
ncbi:S1C family serine protease [Arthrobacter sp. 35W]|uniref:S1C family serine protease n=1 Tax=Arthrobacter sp. 35W TaxID=1132441 RepID=UPI0004103A3D|nr:trypsin-like peptidase domain-containing protein [Arthrobacter sp. 35W]